VKILYINTFDPFVEFHGGATVTKRELALISDIADVDTLFGQPLKRRRKDIDKFRLVFDVLRGHSLKQASYNILHRRAEFFRPYDLIFCNHDFAAYDYQTFIAMKKPFIVRKLNAEHKLVDGTRLHSAAERRRIERFERCLGASAAAVIHLSSTEFAEDDYSRTKHHLFPPLVPDDLLTDGELSPYAFADRTIDILCVANYEWHPNREGFDWFFAQVAPLLKPGTNIHLVGKGGERYRGFLGVTVHGYVDDVTDFYRHAKVFIAPILSGAGIKIKNLEALLFGVPIVSTTIGSEGLSDVAVLGGVSNSDTAADFAANIASLLADEARSTQQRLTGHAWAMRNVLSSDEWKRRLQGILQNATRT